MGERRTVVTSRRLAWGALLAVVLVIGLAIGGQLAARTGPDAVASTTVATPAAVPAALPAALPAGALALQNAYVAALRVATPSVVEIATSTGLGSGIVYDAKGDVVTNAHVVGSSTSFHVLLASGREVSARLVGKFVPDDLAVVRLASAAGTRPASFANSSVLQAGDIVLAIGSPFGLAGSVTEGIVSSTGRSVSESDKVLLPDTIQTSAAINPGNSGGALIDLSGQVVGIPTLATTQQSGSEAAGIGFAIPSNRVRLIAPQLIANGRVTSAGRAALGISGSTAEDVSGQAVGVYVEAVTPGGPAATAGIQVGDVITALAGHPTSSYADLQAVLATLRPGARASVTVVRAGATHQFSVVLGDLANE